MKRELVVITGCDSGIGKACAGLLLKEGIDVAVSYMEKNPFPDDSKCHAFRMDIRKEAHIRSFVKSIARLCREEYWLSCLFCNAGIALGGPVENTPMSTFREVLEVNYFGCVSLVQKLIPSVRESRGMILINGSMAGRVAPPFMAPYSSSKFALEGFSDALRRELSPFGIRTVIIEPAAVATPIWTKARKLDKSFVDEVYMESIDYFLNNYVESGSRGMPVEKASAGIVKIMRMKNPKPRYIIAGTPLNSFLQTLLPDRILDRLIKKYFRMNYH